MSSNAGASIVNKNSSKKEYQSPKLLIYGDFRSLTFGGSGTSNNDGGGRKTKVDV